MEKWTFVFQKFETHDKIISIHTHHFLGVSAKSQKRVIYIEITKLKTWRAKIQDTHISVTFSAKYDAKWFCCADTK